MLVAICYLALLIRFGILWIFFLFVCCVWNTYYFSWLYFVGNGVSSVQFVSSIACVCVCVYSLKIALTAAVGYSKLVQFSRFASAQMWMQFLSTKTTLWKFPYYCNALNVDLLFFCFVFMWILCIYRFAVGDKNQWNLMRNNIAKRIAINRFLLFFFFHYLNLFDFIGLTILFFFYFLFLAIGLLIHSAPQPICCSIYIRQMNFYLRKEVVYTHFNNLLSKKKKKKKLKKKKNRCCFCMNANFDFYLSITNDISNNWVCYI